MTICGLTGEEVVSADGANGAGTSDAGAGGGAASADPMAESNDDLEPPAISGGT